MRAGCVTGSGCPAVRLGYTCGVYFAARWWIRVIGCSGRKVCPGFYYVCTRFPPYHRSSRFDVLFMFSYSNLRSLLHKHWRANTHTDTHTQMLLGACGCIRSPPPRLNVVHLKLVRPPLSSSPYSLFRWLPRHGKCQALFASAVWLLQTFVKC